jgi:arginyl-tRNA synthetase
MPGPCAFRNQARDPRAFVYNRGKWASLSSIPSRKGTGPGEREAQLAIMYETELNALGSQIRTQIERDGGPSDLTVEWTPIPLVHQWGIGTSVCLKAAAALVRAGRSSLPVPEEAQHLAETIAKGLSLSPDFAGVEASRGYVNLYFDTRRYVSHVLREVLGSGPGYGRGAPKAERVMVEFAQPNTHHSFHIGHFRNAVLGESLARLADFAGFETVRASYPGDIGLGVIRCLWAYRRFHQGQEPEGVMERGRWLASIYTEATGLLEPASSETEEQRKRREAYEREVKDLYQKWDAGDPEIRALWLRTRQWSLDELAEILRLLRIPIDVFFFESEADEPAKRIVEELIQRGIAEDERAQGGPVVVHIDEKLGLGKETYRTAVLLRSDGTTLYLTKDLALARIKFENFHIDRSIYVVDVRQSLHFQQVFKILRLWGFDQASKCFHLAYEMVILPEGTMSARRGRVVYFMEVAEEAQRRILEIIAKKNPELKGPERDQVAWQVGLGALKYVMLSVDNTKQITFSWESALSFDGQAAPYIQYAHVRAASILQKAGTPPEPVDPDYALTPAEIDLVDLISRFPAEVLRAALEYKPLYMANYAYSVARAFTEFYQTCPVLQAGPGERGVRLAIVAAARQTLANSLRLLGIDAPDEM